MASADFTINSLSIGTAIAVSESTTVNLALVSTTGVSTVEWSIQGSHDPAASNPTITPAGAPVGATASFPMPAGAGQAYRVRCVINGGVDAKGAAKADYIKTAVVGVLDAGGRVPLASGETTERHSTHGWTKLFNDVSAGQFSSLALTNGFSYDNGTSFVRPEATVTHTGATTITADSYTTSGSEPQTFIVSALFMGSETGGGGNFVFRRSRKFSRTGGTLAALDAIETIGNDYTDYATVAIDLDASGDDIRARITGEAATTINGTVKWGFDYHVGA